MGGVLIVRGALDRIPAVRAAAEQVLFTRQLADILTYAQQVQAIDTSGVPATAHVHETHSGAMSIVVRSQDLQKDFLVFATQPCAHLPYGAWKSPAPLALQFGL